MPIYGCGDDEISGSRRLYIPVGIENMRDHGNGCMESSVRPEMDTVAFSGAWV